MAALLAIWALIGSYFAAARRPGLAFHQFWLVPQVVGTPFMYTVLRLFAWGRYDRDYLLFQIVSTAGAALFKPNLALAPAMLLVGWLVNRRIRRALWRPVTFIVRNVLGPPTGAIGLLAFEVCAASLAVYALAMFDLATLRREHPR